MNARVPTCISADKRRATVRARRPPKSRGAKISSSASVLYVRRGERARAVAATAGSRANGRAVKPLTRRPKACQCNRQCNRQRNVINRQRVTVSVTVGVTVSVTVGVTVSVTVSITVSETVDGEAAARGGRWTVGKRNAAAVAVGATAPAHRGGIGWLWAARALVAAWPCGCWHRLRGCWCRSTSLFPTFRRTEATRTPGRCATKGRRA